MVQIKRAPCLNNMCTWADQLLTRPSGKRGRKANRIGGELADQLHERHEASDVDTKTQGKGAAPGYGA